MREHYGRVLAFARAMTGSWSTAEDLCQEAFLAAYRRWDEVSRYEWPAGFVRRVVANRSVSGTRRRVAEAAALRRVHSLRSAPPADTEVADPEFWTAVRRLPARQRSVLALHYVDDLPIRAIADVLDIAEGTVKAHLHSGRQALGRLLGESHEEEP